MLVALLTLALLIALALGFHVFSAAPERSENRGFALFAWVLALWLLNDLVFWGFHGPDTDGRWWAQTAFLVALAMHWSFIRFIWVFPGPRPFAGRKAWPLVIPLAVVVPLVLSGKALGAVGFEQSRFHVSFTPWTFVVGGYNYALLLVGLALAEWKRRRATDPQGRRELLAVLLGPAVMGALTTVGVILLPLGGVYDLLPYSGLAVLAGMAIHAYAVLNLRMLMPTSVLSRIRVFPVTAKLSVAVAACSLATVAVVLAVAWKALGRGAWDPGWTQAVVFGLVAASVPAMGLVFLAQRIVTRPLRRLTETAIQVGEGRMDVRADLGLGGRDEVAVLALAFNDMVDRLDKDMHALRDMSEGLLRAERLATAGTLAAGVAHEVNNPLAAVSSLVQTARGRTEDPRSCELLDDALAQMDRVAATIADLARLTRPRSAAPRPCDLNGIVEATARLLRYDRRFRGVDVQLRPAPDLPQALADPDRVQQVLLNLLFNARDAVSGKEAGRIEVATRALPGFLEVCVRDNGRGIAAEDLPRVCEPFYTTKPAGEGTGLGLAVCRDIAREHGGRLDFQSEPGRGTAVRFTVPVAEAKA